MPRGKMIRIREPRRHAKIRRAGAAGKIRLVPERLRITGRNK